MSTGLTQQLAGYGNVFAAEVDTLARETSMTSDQEVIPIDRGKNDEKKSPWRRVGVLVGAAAVIIASIGGLAVLRSENDAITAPPFSTAEDAGRAIENAVRLGDWEAFRSAFADDALSPYYTDGEPFSENEELAEGRFAWLVAGGFRPIVQSCLGGLDGSATCTVLMDDDLLVALGAEPIVEIHEYRISDGLLVSEEARPEEEDSLPAILQAYLAWAEETNHPARAAEIEYFLNPVIADAPVVAAAVLDAAEEFLAQYSG